MTKHERILRKGTKYFRRNTMKSQIVVDKATKEIICVKTSAGFSRIPDYPSIRILQRKLTADSRGSRRFTAISRIRRKNLKREH